MYTNSTNGTWHGNRCKFDDLEFWPERGMIRIVDTRDESYETLSVRTALERLQAIVASADRSWWPDDRKKMLDFADHMLRCCKIARAQGDPLDPKIIMRDIARGRGMKVSLPTVDITRADGSKKKYFDYEVAPLAPRFR